MRLLGLIGQPGDEVDQVRLRIGTGQAAVFDQGAEVGQTAETRRRRRGCSRSAVTARVPPSPAAAGGDGAHRTASRASAPVSLNVD